MFEKNKGIREFTGKSVEIVDGVFEIGSHDLSITASGSSTVSTVRVIPLDETEDTAQIVRDTVIQQDGKKLSIILPENQGGGIVQNVSGGSVTVNGVRYQGPVSIVNGVVRGIVTSGSGAVVIGGRGVRVDVQIPSGSSARVGSLSGDVDTRGFLDLLRVNTISGGVRADEVGELLGGSTSGDLEADVVRRVISVTTISGDVDIHSYHGSEANLRSVSGDLELNAASGATGEVHANTVSGDIRLRGTRGQPGLDVKTRTVSGYIRKD